MKTIIACDRTHCTISDGKKVTHRALCWDYVCADCEGTLALFPVVVDDVVLRHDARCGRCDGQRIISNREIRKQVEEAVTTLTALPPALQRVAQKARSKRRDEQLDVVEAMKALY